MQEELDLRYIENRVSHALFLSASAHSLDNKANSGSSNKKRRKKMSKEEKRRLQQQQMQ